MIILNESERNVNYNFFHGDQVLIPHVTFSRKGTHFCIYCGNVSDTREHAPSKVFLSNPYPENLPVLPACKKCNNSFSDDELYTEVYIDSLKYLSGRQESLRKENQERIYRNSAFIDAQNDLRNYYDIGEMSRNIKIKRILTKLAICHSVFELSEGFYCDSWDGLPASIDYKFSFEMKQNEIREFDNFIDMNDKILPEVGSRVFGKILVFQPVLTPINGGENINANLVVMDWSDIQEGNYKYVAWFEKDDSFHVRIVIHDFIYAEVVFRRKECI